VERSDELSLCSARILHRTITNRLPFVASLLTDGGSTFVKDLRAWECYGEETLTSVDGSDNPSLTTIDEIFVDAWSSLLKLRFRRCSLSSFPFHTVSENLQMLDLSDNRLQGVMRVDGWGFNLRKLILSSNHLTGLEIR
jgi:hypothetical protein